MHYHIHAAAEAMYIQLSSGGSMDQEHQHSLNKGIIMKQGHQHEHGHQQDLW